MKNDLLAPELRELLNKKDIKGLQEFCASAHPGTTAEFLSALAPEEVWEALKVLEPRLRAEIFGHLDEDLQVSLAESLKRQELAEIVTHMFGDERLFCLC